MITLKSEQAKKDFIEWMWSSKRRSSTLMCWQINAYSNFGDVNIRNTIRAAFKFAPNLTKAYLEEYLKCKN